ncbi:hypothetical protein PILCRDRAFT_91595 [Piloderma croceum F 1598]|uniref:Uncharacterized protein n=1 Tax=Piloderma croceum (strain F 1598) TaxID=765440 RepID=A0A0C3BGQ9_PILCF|nr:hypothetical protein PILCRDRAFT_91595 [Piloderma croceum F 1598]
MHPSLGRSHIPFLPDDTGDPDNDNDTDPLPKHLTDLNPHSQFTRIKQYTFELERVQKVEQKEIARQEEQPPELSPLANRYRPHIASDTSAGPSAMDLHDSLAEHARNRSGSGRDVHSMKLRERRVAVDILLGDQGYYYAIIIARNGVIRMLGLERSLNPLRVMQNSSSASSLIVKCEVGQEGNERLLVPDRTPETIVDFEDIAVDTDEEEKEYGEVSDRPEGVNSAIISTAPKFPFGINRPPSTDLWTSNFSPYPTLRHMKRAAIASEAIPLLALSTNRSANTQLNWSTTIGTHSDEREYDHTRHFQYYTA